MSKMARKCDECGKLATHTNHCEDCHNAWVDECCENSFGLSSHTIGGDE
jgi:hypothetical protein